MRDWCLAFVRLNGSFCWPDLKVMSLPLHEILICFLQNWGNKKFFDWVLTPFLKYLLHFASKIWHIFTSVWWFVISLDHYKSNPEIVSPAVESAFWFSWHLLFLVSVIQQLVLFYLSASSMCELFCELANSFSIIGISHDLFIPPYYNYFLSKVLLNSQSFSRISPGTLPKFSPKSQLPDSFIRLTRLNHDTVWAP